MRTNAKPSATFHKAPSSAFLLSRYILRLGQAAQKQQRPRCPNLKMYLEIRRADECLYSHFSKKEQQAFPTKRQDKNRVLQDREQSILKNDHSSVILFLINRPDVLLKKYTIY